MSELNIQFIANFVDNLTGPSRRVLNQFGNSMMRSRRSLDSSLQRAANLSLVGAEASRMGRSIAQSLKAPIEAAANFEEAMSAVKAITGANQSEFQSLINTARNLGETTSFSASEAAAGMRYLGMAGFETHNIIQSMPGVLNLAKAGALDLGRAADISSDILTGFGLTANDMGRVGDVLAKTFTSSNTTLEMLGETMKYVGPLAKTAGVDIETIAAMTGLLGNAGIKGSQAGTTLRAMLTRLTAPSNTAKKSLRSLGVEVENMDGNMRHPLDIIEDLQTGLDGLGNVEQMALLKDIFGEEPASGVAELIISQGRDAIETYQKRLYAANGTSARIAKEMGDNAKGGIKEYQSAIESLNITIGDKLLPTITPLIRDITDLVRQLTSWAAANPELVRTIAMATAGLAALLLVVGPIASILSGVITAFAILKYSASVLMAMGLLPLKLAFSAVIGVVKALGIALLTNPIGLAITAIAVGAALIIANWDTVKTFFIGLWEGIKSLFNDGINWINKLMNDPVGTLLESWGGLKTFYSGLWSTIGNITMTVFNRIADLVTDPIGTLKKDWSIVIDFFKNIWGNVKSLFNDAVGWMTEMVTQPIQTLKETFGSAWDWITKTIEGPSTDIQVAKQTLTELNVNTSALPEHINQGVPLSNGPSVVIAPSAKLPKTTQQSMSSVSTTKSNNEKNINIKMNVNIKSDAASINENKLSQLISEKVEVVVSEYFGRGETV